MFGVENKEMITEDEAALYDRQIRLWGLDAQKRLRNAKILVCGVCGLGAEITKNLVLAGVKSLTLLDHRPVTHLDVVSNFLAPSDSIGKNIAEASKERAQKLNPMVEVFTDVSDIQKLPVEYFTKFDCVISTRCLYKNILTRIDEACRNMNCDTLFFIGGVYGMFGFMFSDLKEHEYVEEQIEKTEVEVDGVKRTSEEVKLIKKKASFVSFTDAMNVDWTEEKYSKRVRRMSCGYFLMHVLFEFYRIHERLPMPETREADITELLTIRHALLPKMEIPEKKIPDNFVDLLFGQVSPVCAIVGGAIAAEVIKAVSQKESPHNNFFFFSPLDDGAGVVHCIGN